MEKDYDVIIIGAGPAGLKCAQELNGSDLSVLLIEKNKVIGPKICAGGLTGLATTADIPMDKVRRFDSQIIFLGDKEYRMKLVNPVFTVDRYDLGQYLLGKIKGSQNITVLTGTIVKSVNERNIETNKGSFSFKYLVGADGSNSIVRKKIVLETTHRSGLYCEIPAVTNDLIWYFNPSLLKAGYIWVFPHSKFTNIGIYYFSDLISHKEARKILTGFLEARGCDYSKAEFRGAPVACCYRGSVFDNLYLAGDAAGTASKMTGEGISFALTSGSETGKKILDPDYKMPQLRKVLIVKWIQKALLKIFVWFNFAPFIQKFFFRLLVVFLRFRWFQYFFGNKNVS